jgi:secreted PhoX family phosphatase
VEDSIMVQVDRRTFLKGAAATAGVAALGGPFSGFVNVAQGASQKPSFRTLRPVQDERDDVVRLWLPDGFSYRSFHDTTVPITLDDGTALPGRHDGMAAFPGDGATSVLIRNHEVNANAEDGAFGPHGDWTYDTSALSGCTHVDVTPTGEVLNAFTALNGTQMNCAGGRMPWGSWITCEETVNGPDVGPDFTGFSNVLLTQPHGFIFEVPAEGRASGQPIRSAGRFAHEAVAFDPDDGILYLTEDNFGFPSGFYRYIPPSNPMETGQLEDGGRLQMLAVAGIPNANLAARQRRRANYKVRWVDIEDPAPSFTYTPGLPAPTTNNDALNYVGSQGRAQGAAKFSRLEGAVYDNGVIYFTSTQGGGDAEPTDSDNVGGWGNGSGQIWAYHTKSRHLRLLYQSPNRATLDFPDNITTSPRGTIILCEDNTEDNYIRGLSRGGQLWDIALNRMENRTGDEFAGSTFSDDGDTLFVNIQASRGLTFAIWGPWHKIGV